MRETATGYFLDTPGEPLARRELALPDPGPDEVVVEVLACGLCHTDLGYADGSVAPRHALPLVLGHEIVGTVVAAGPEVAALAGRRVLVPAVMPCGRCAYCRAGRANACPDQKMPGNDIHGGFATHVLVPGAPLVDLSDAPATVDLRELSVVADAVSTAYQAVRRSGLEAGDLALVVGAGGVGGFLVQIACALGARVVACDVRSDRLDALRDHGAEATFEVAGRPPQETKKAIHALARSWGIPSLGWRIFECSGTAPGQALAWALLGRAANLVQVGFTPQSVELRFSNLMAFDATAHGSWGCPPALYPEVLRLIYDGRVALSPFLAYAGMSRLAELLDEMAAHRLSRRMVLDPRS
jgi:6-hydroxycyclohex-1-ene-1-carbonyl-CoA dehydrogenase